MKSFAIPILVFLLMSQTFSNWLVVMAFDLNRGYIAKNLCENRYRPKLNCNGKCVLMKKLKEREKEEQDQPATRVDVTTVVLSSRSFFVTDLPQVVVSLINSEADTRTVKPVDISLPVFQPPWA